MAPSSSRNGTPVIWVVVHTAEGIRDVDDLRAFFDRSTNSSSHAGADDEKLSEGWVPYDRAAWTLRNGNARSDNLELCWFAKATREEWLRDHMGMLNNAARWIRSRCLARDIPMVKLSPADVRAGRAGVIGHHDYTQGTGDGTHWDPGPGFPWDVVMAKARGEEDMQADERSWLADLHMTVVSGARRDKQLNKDLGYVVDQVGGAKTAATAAKTEAQAAKTAAQAALDRSLLLTEQANTLNTKLDQVSSKVDSLALGGVDVQALAALLAPAVADVLAKRLES